MKNSSVKNILALLLVSLCFATAFAQTIVTKSDYERAEKAMAYNTSQLIDRANVRPNWLPDDSFWYRILTANGSEFVMVDPTTGIRKPAFDAVKLSASMSKASGRAINPSNLQVSNLTYSNNKQEFSFFASKMFWTCDIQANECAITGGTKQSGIAGRSPRDPGFENVSPDKKRAAFIRDYNLWIRDLATKKETQLTTDGIKDYGYATDNAGWIHSDRAILVWSPDSKKIATFQQDQRKVGDMYLVSTNVGHPKLQSWKYPLPGDENVTMIERVVIDVDTQKVTRLQLPPDQHRSTLCDDISCRGGDWSDVEWSADGKNLAFVSTSRDHKIENLRVADAATGAIREVFEEKTDTQFESGQGRVNWRYLPASNEFIWFSERDNWGHLYLYDLTTGKLKNQITSGQWAVTELLKVDEAKRVLYFIGLGKEKAEDPYFAHLYSIGFDGKNLKSLTPESGNHEVSFSPSEKYIFDTFSKPDVPQESVVRNLDGKILVNVEKTDISRLTATGWKPPQPIIVKARDGVTDLYGLMFSPSNLDKNKKYPIINYVYPGPQGGGVGSRSFLAARGDNQALSELGFIVVSIDGTCNPLRSKKFHDACYGNMADNTLPDQIAGMKQLAAKYPWIDIERAGIWGHSGGGFATAAAMFRYPDFFKVGISESGNHENRNYEDDWGERYIGLLTKDASGKSNYEDQANQNFAKNLQGHLMLAHGMLDDNVPPYNTMLVVEALNKANKDYDLVIFPNSRHGYGEFSPYMTRRRWDYFVRYLMGAEPPKEYELKTKADPRNDFGK